MYTMEIRCILFICKGTCTSLKAVMLPYSFAVCALLKESRHDKDKSEKKRDSTGAKEDKKQYPLM